MVEEYLVSTRPLQPAHSGSKATRCEAVWKLRPRPKGDRESPDCRHRQTARIGPGYGRIPASIRAHAKICVFPLVLLCVGLLTLRRIGHTIWIAATKSA